MNHFFGIRKRYWYSDIDIHARPEIVRKLSDLTSHPYVSVQNLTLTPEFKNISMYSSQSALPTWVMPTYFRPTRKKCFGQQVCPHCLRENGYYNKLWRLGVLTGCPIHKTELMDRCPVCDTAISLRNIKTRCTLEALEDILKCNICGFDYRKAMPLKLSEAHLKLTNWFYYLLGFTDRNDSTLSMPNRCIYSNQMFEGIRYLAEIILCRKKSSIKLYPSNRFLNASNLQPIHFPINDRINMILLIGRWLEDWPDNFLKAIFDNQLRLNDIIGKRDLVPWWINKVILEDVSKFRFNNFYLKSIKNNSINKYQGLINKALYPKSPAVFWGDDIREIFFSDMEKLIKELENSKEYSKLVRVHRDRLWYGIMSDYKVTYLDVIKLNLNKGIYEQLGKRVEKRYPISKWKNTLIKLNKSGIAINIKNPRFRFKGYLKKFGFPLSIRITCLYRV